MKYIWYLQGFTKWIKTELSRIHYQIHSMVWRVGDVTANFVAYISCFWQYLLGVVPWNKFWNQLAVKKVFYAKNTEVATEKLQIQATTSQLLTQDSYQGKRTIFGPSRIIRYLLSSTMGTEDSRNTENLVIQYTYTYCLYPIKFLHSVWPILGQIVSPKS